MVGFGAGIQILFSDQLVRFPENNWKFLSAFKHVKHVMIKTEIIKKEAKFCH